MKRGGVEYTSIRLPRELLEKMDQLVKEGRYESRLQLALCAIDYFMRHYKPGNARNGYGHILIPVPEIERIRRIVKKHPELKSANNVIRRAVEKLLEQAEEAVAQ